MRLLHYFWLLAGPMASLGWAATANLDIWEIDKACSNYHDGSVKDTTGLTGGSNEVPYVQDAFNVALDMAIAGQQSLIFALQKRPSGIRHPSSHKKWVRIVDTMAVTLGFYSDNNKDEDASDPNWSKAFAIFDKIVTTLQGTENDPAHGYNEQLQKANPNQKPVIACGDNWDWIGMDDDLPDEAVHLEDFFTGKIQSGFVGAWYKSRRFEFVRRVREKPIFCLHGVRALTMMQKDMITLCDEVFTDEVKTKKSPAQVKTDGTIKVGSHIDDYRDNLAFTILHELMHWYGGVDGGPVEYENRAKSVIMDRQAVDEKGLCYYWNAAYAESVSYPKELDSKELKLRDWLPVGAYKQEWVWNLAVVHKEYSFSGPDRALTNADSLSMFCLMMYLDNWNWAKEGKARKQTVF